MGLLVAIGCAPTEPSSGEGNDPPWLLWTRGEPAGARATPLAVDDLAVFTTSSDRRVVALDLRDGRLRWQRTLADGPGAFNLPAANIVSAANLIIVPGWGLYGLDKSSGAVRWSLTQPDEYPAASPVATDGRRIISPGSLRHLYAVDAATGALQWSVDLGERPFAPVLAGDTVYVGTSGPINSSGVLGAGHAVALRAIDGQVLWRAPLPNAPPPSPWLGGTNKRGAVTASAFVVASSNGRVYAFDRATGAVRWEFAGSGPFASGVVALETVVIAASTTGEIVGLDADNGLPRWRIPGGSSVTEQITTDGACAFIERGAIHCVDAAGRMRWTIGGYSNGGPGYLTPVFPTADRLLAGSENGFHALGYRRP